VRNHAVDFGKPTNSSRSPSTPNPKIVKQTQDRRIQQQIQLATRETDYYADLFTRRGLNSQDFRATQMTELPVTTKETLHDRPHAFVRRGFHPTLCTMTTGTTDQGTTNLFTDRETQIFSSMSALSLLRQGLISSADIVQVSTSARALLGNQTFMDACRQVGALVYQTGVIEPEQTLALLAQKHKLSDRKKRVSVLYTYPSYLGKLLEKGLALGYGPQDFGLERIIVGGEVSSPGIQQRSEALFGPVTFSEGYGISEVWPFGGAYCEAGHLHFDPLRGLMEIIDPETAKPVQPGQAGTLVLTPFLPYRESSVLLRFDTGDMVRNLVNSCTCSLSQNPAASALLGKQRFCVHTEFGWFGPRDILQILEPNIAIPLPVRFSLFGTADGLRLEIAVREAKTTLHREITAQLQSAGIPVGILKLVTDPDYLEHPLPWRGDLHEGSFSTIK